MGQFGRPKTYRTPAALRRAVGAYFDSIEFTRDVSAGNKKIKLTDYAQPPGIGALCLHLGISRRTWANYCDEKKYPMFAPICEEAKLRIEAYLENELVSRQKGSLQGIIFNLQNNYDWKQKNEIELGEKTRETAESLSLSEKIAFIKRAAALCDGSESEDDSSDGDVDGTEDDGGATNADVSDV